MNVIFEFLRSIDIRKSVLLVLISGAVYLSFYTANYSYSHSIRVSTLFSGVFCLLLLLGIPIGLYRDFKNSLPVLYLREAVRDYGLGELVEK